MAGNRKKAEQELLAGIEAILPGGGNDELYKARLSEMSDRQFEEMIDDWESGRSCPSIIVPNKYSTADKIRLSVKRNLELAKLWGHEFFERIWFHHGDDRPPYLSNEKYLICDQILRRQAQLLTKKISIPEDNKSVDDYTGQPTGKSKGSRLSYPEIQLMASAKLDYGILELIRLRGGDTASFHAMNEMLSRNGSVSQKVIEPYGGKVKSTETLHTLLTCMHYDSTLLH